MIGIRVLTITLSPKKKKKGRRDQETKREGKNKASKKGTLQKTS